jgi:hypothetical protein
MLEHLRQRVIGTLAGVTTVTLTTNGAAGLQASHLPCQASGILLYVFVPRSSDHLFNLESQPEVVVLDEIWSLKGQALILAPSGWPPALRARAKSEWTVVLEIRPTQITLVCPATGSPTETIDID